MEEITNHNFNNSDLFLLIAQSARIQHLFFEPIQSEIKAIFMKLLTIHGVKNESISKFLNYLRNPVNVPTEYLSEFLLISQHLNMTESEKELLTILKNNLENDDILIQNIVYCSKSSLNFPYSAEVDKIAIEVERFNRIFTNPLFEEIDVRTVHRLLSKIRTNGDLNRISHDNLYDYIHSDIQNRNSLFQFVNIGLLSQTKYHQFLSEVKRADPTTREYYLFLECPIDFLVQQANEFEQYKNEIEKLKEDKKNLEQANYQLTQQHTIEIDDLKQIHNKEIDLFKEDKKLLESKINQLTHDNKNMGNELTKLKQRTIKMDQHHKNNIEQLNEQHKAEVDQLNEQHKAEVEQLNEQHKAEVDQLNEQHKAEIDQLNEQSKAEIEKMNQQSNQMLATLQQERQQSALTLFEYKSEIEELKRDKNRIKSEPTNLLTEFQKLTQLINEKFYKLYKVPSENNNFISFQDSSLNNMSFESNWTEAISIFKRMIENGSNNLAFCYQYGLGTTQNREMAFRFYNMSSQIGNVFALTNLAFCYENGIGTQKDAAKAFHFYNLASEAGSLYATTILANYYKNAVPCNHKKAFQLYQIASERGIIEATYQLGNCFENGIGVAKNMEEANRFYTIASNKGHIQATVRLGYDYENGIGVEKNLLEAFRCYQVASSAGDIYSTAHLAYFYQTGLGVQKDLVKAAQLYKKASDAGDEYSTQQLSNCYRYGLGVSRNGQEANRLSEIVSENESFV